MAVFVKCRVAGRMTELSICHPAKAGVDPIPVALPSARRGIKKSGRRFSPYDAS